MKTKFGTGIISAPGSSYRLDQDISTGKIFRKNPEKFLAASGTDEILGGVWDSYLKSRRTPVYSAVHVKSCRTKRWWLQTLSLHKGSRNGPMGLNDGFL